MFSHMIFGAMVIFNYTEFTELCTEEFNMLRMTIRLILELDLNTPKDWRLWHLIICGMGSVVKRRVVHDCLQKLVGSNHFFVSF